MKNYLVKCFLDMLANSLKILINNDDFCGGGYIRG